MAFKNTSSKILLIIFLVIAAVPALLFAFNFSRQNSNGISSNQDGIANNPGPNSNVADVPSVPGLPMRLKIPSINVDAPVIYVALAKDGSVAVPKGPDEVAWFKLGPRPGQKGSAVITGHFGPWITGAHSVFDNLYKLKKGDKVLVEDDKGESLSFTVRDTAIYKPNEAPEEVFNKDDGTYLNLITCNGQWLASQKTYTQRLVIFTNADI